VEIKCIRDVAVLITGHPMHTTFVLAKQGVLVFAIYKCQQGLYALDTGRSVSRVLYPFVESSAKQFFSNSFVNSCDLRLSQPILFHPRVVDVKDQCFAGHGCEWNQA